MPKLTTSEKFAAFTLRKEIIAAQNESNLDLNTFQEYEKLVQYEEIFQGIALDLKNLLKESWLFWRDFASCPSYCCDELAKRMEDIENTKSSCEQK